MSFLRNQVWSNDESEPLTLPDEDTGKTRHRASDFPILLPSLSRVKRPLTLTLSPRGRGERGQETPTRERSPYSIPVMRREQKIIGGL